MGEALHLLQVDGWMDVALLVQFEEWGWGVAGEALSMKNVLLG